MAVLYETLENKIVKILLPLEWILFGRLNEKLRARI